MGVFGNGYIRQNTITSIEESIIIFENEGNNYSKIFESINILAEASIKTAFQTIVQKIKDFFIWLGNKIKELWNKIFHRHKTTEQRAETVVKKNEEIREEIKKLPEKKDEAKDNKPQNIQKDIDVIDSSKEEELKDTKNQTISNIQDRHAAAREEIMKSVEQIKKNRDESEKRSSEFEKLAKDYKELELKVDSKQEVKEKIINYQIYDEYLANYLQPILSSFEITKYFIEIVDQRQLKDRSGNPYSNEDLEELCSSVYERGTNQTTNDSDAIIRSLSIDRLQNLKDKEGNFETASDDIKKVIEKLDSTLETCSKMKIKFEKEAKKYEHLDISVSKEFAENAICQKYITKCIAEDADRIKNYLAALMTYTNAIESLKAKMISQLDSVNKQIANI